MSEREVSVRLAVAAGARTLEQQALGREARRRLAHAGRELQQVLPFMYEHSGIVARHFEVDPVEAEQRKDWLQVLNEATRSLAARVLTDVLASAPRPAALIVVSSTHSGFPGLSRWLQHQLELPPEMLCLDLAGTGCAGAPHALHVADTLLSSGTPSVCVVCVDALGTLSQVGAWSPEQSMSQVVAHCLASDGAAAMLLRAGGLQPGDDFTYRRAHFVSRLWPGSFTWNAFGVDGENRPYFSVGKEIRTHLAGEVRAVLDAETGASPVVAHPGGVALLHALEDGFPHLRPYLELSMQELHDHGNFGSPSVLRVLRLSLDRGVALWPTFSLISFGPGKVTALLKYEGARAAR